MTKPSSAASSALLSPFARSVLELYAEAMPDVRFPDLDLAALQALAEEVCDAQGEVDRAELELQDAKERFAARGAALHARAERALSYARIYADGNPALSDRVDAVRKLPGESLDSAPRKRGRPRKGHEGQLEVLDAAAE